MQLVSQLESVKQLEILANNSKHSTLISGIAGSGKTYLAKHYAKLLNISDFQIVEPKVQVIKDAINSCYQTNKPVVLCIENLDMGLLTASYTLLKFLEEPLSYVYLVVTCRNIKQLPDTIISRSATVTVAPPTDYDLLSYGKYLNDSALDNLTHTSNLWSCVKTLNDVDTVLSLTKGQIDYFNSLNDLVYSNDNISSLCWKLQNYSSNSENTNNTELPTAATPIELVIKYIMTFCNNDYIWKMGHQCLKDLSTGRISVNAVVAKFLFEIKYGG